MSKPKLSTKTPDAAEVNNLIEMHGQIIDNPEGELIAIVRILPSQVVHRVADGEDQATVALRQIEVLQGADVEKGRALMLKSFRTRTNGSALPDLNDPKPTPDTPIAGLEDAGVEDTLK